MFQLYKFMPEVPDPALATTELRGEIPARALKFCEPFLVANSAGALVFPPVGITLTWSGSEVTATLEGIEETILVDRFYLPDSVDSWKEIAPDDAQDALPPFIEAFPERGVLQIWTGLFVSTPSGVATWVRSPVNRNIGSGYAITEGIVETDWWTGPLFFVMELQRTHFPIVLRRDEPIVQIIPVPRTMISVSNETILPKLVAEAPDRFWKGFVSTASRRNSEGAGSYRRTSRRRLRVAELTLDNESK